MTMEEQFSAFLDNEATTDETDSVVSRLLRDESMRNSWCRQHWIRETLRTSSGETAVGLDLAFSERVMQAVREEGPGMEEAAGETVSESVVPMPRPRQRHRWRTTAGFAVAASAAGIVLFAAEPMLPGGQTQVPPVQTTQHGAAHAGTASASANTTSTAGSKIHGLQMAQSLASDMIQNVSSHVEASQEAVDHWQVSNQVLANRLNGYLVEHNGLARAYGLGATTPGLIRVATYGQTGLR